MGNTYSFKCMQCEYEQAVSGGDDRGMQVKTTTIVCRKCRELYDVVTGEIENDFADIPICCPKGKKHNVERWTEPWLCPKCGSPMHQLGISVLWD